MRNKQGDFIWYELLTADAAAATAFYGKVLGWTSQANDMGTMVYHIVSAADGNIGGMMDIPADAKAGGMKPAWLGYVGVDDVDASAAKIVAEGGSQHIPPTDIPGVGRFAMLQDPFGATFYVMRGAMDETSTVFDPTKYGHCFWNELTTPDQAAAWTFYGSQFGWKKGDVMPMGEIGDYEFLDHAGQTIGAFSPVFPGGRPMWTFYFGVEDIDEALERVKAGGGTVVQGPDEVPGGMFVINANDPQGARFGLVGNRKS